MSKIVYRTLDFFELFAAQKRPLSLTELTKLLDVPLSSCHDVVRALEQRGYLYEVKARMGYYPTAKLFEVAKVLVDNDPVSQRAEPILQALSSALNASVSLGKAKDAQLTYLVVCAPDDPLRFSVTVGSTARNLYATSAGKAVLGSFPLARQKAILAETVLTPLTPHTITSKAVLLKDLELSEKRGWYENREESVEDALTVSTRFTWNGSTYVITVAGTLNRMERQFDHVVGMLLETTRELSGQGQ